MKHGVTFDDAVTVFVDANALDVRLGCPADGRVLMVAYTIRRRADVEAIRLISARRASRRERAAYDAED